MGFREVAYESQITWSLWHKIKLKVVNVWRGRMYVDNYNFCKMHALQCQKQLSIIIAFAIMVIVIGGGLRSTITRLIDCKKVGTRCGAILGRGKLHNIWKEHSKDVEKIQWSLVLVGRHNPLNHIVQVL